MTTFLRYFIFALTPLLGVTTSFGPAVLFGVVATILLVSASGLVAGARGRMASLWLFWAVVGLEVVLVTLVDLLFSWLLPEIRQAWGFYLNILPFLPLMVVLPLDRTPARSASDELSKAVKSGLVLTSLLAIGGLVRDFFGNGAITLVPQQVSLAVPGLDQGPLHFVTTGAGAFFLAAAAVVVFRALRPRWPRLSQVMEDWSLGPQSSLPVSTTEEPRVVPSKTEAVEATKVEKRDPVPERHEPVGEWGEDLPTVVRSLASNDVQRILVIGTGNGEMPYYLAMLALDEASGRGLKFRVRGVDHFSTRIETAVRGVFREHQIDFIPADLRERWMVRGVGEDKYLWRVAEGPRLHVQFEVADFHNGTVYFPQPAHVIVLNQGMDYIGDEKKGQILVSVCEHLAPGGALILPSNFRRQLVPEDLKRTGTTVFRKP